MADDNNIDINIGVNPGSAESGSRRAKAAITGVTADTKQLDAAFRRLKSSIDPTFAAQEKYNAALADNKRLLDAGRISQEEYAAGATAAKNALDAQVQAIQRSSAAGRAAAEEAKRLKREEAQAQRAATAQAVADQRTKAAAERQAATDARALAKQRANEEKAATREAAVAARQAAREKAEAEKQSAREIREAQSQQRAAEKAGIREAARLAREAAREKANAEKTASREAAAAERTAKAEAKAAAREAAAVAKAEAREKLNVERQASREAAEAEKQAKRDQRQASRDAAQAAAQATKIRRDAERDAASAARMAATETKNLARAEREAANAAQELRSSIDPVFAAQTRYNDVMLRATSLLMQNKLKTGEWILIQRQAKAQMDVNVRSMGRMNSMYVQLGYQAQDVTASLASGINPLVILAQQGGQTAAAMSTMGGTVGRVASFFAGPWGAAIIGFTLLLGYLWDSTEEGKGKTLDLMDAEARRKAGLNQLTEALKDFNKEQREANTNETEALRLKGKMLEQTREQARAEMVVAEQRLASLRQRMDELMSTPDPDGGAAGAMAILSIQIWRAESQVKKLKAELREITTGDIELSITNAMEDAEAATDKTKAAQRDYNREVSILTNASRERAKWLADNLTGAARENALAAEQARLTAQIVKAKEHLKKVEKDIADARKTNRSTEETANYTMPVQGRITSGFGARTAPKPGASTFHSGIDIAAPKGTPVKAAQVGTVEAVGYSASLGKYVVLRHGGGVETTYGHMSATGVTKGERVEQGQQIGAVGSTGLSTGNHLHYKVEINGKPVDPKGGIFPIDKLEADRRAITDIVAAERELAQDRVAANETAQAEIAADTSKTSEQQLTDITSLQDKKIGILKEFYGQDSKEVEKAEKDKVNIIKQYNAKILQEEMASLDKRRTIAEGKENTAFAVGQEQTGQEGDEVDFAAQNGLISEREALVAKAQILEQEYQNQEAHEERMYQLELSYLQKKLNLPGQTAQRQQEINDQIEQREQENLNRRERAQAQYARRVAEINRQQAQITMQKWTEITQTFTSAMGSAFQGLWTRSTSIQQSFINMADQMVYKLIDMGLKELQAFLMQQVVKRAAIQTTAAIQTASAIQSAASSKGVNAAAATTEIGQHAAVAAAGAYKSTVVIPFIGPIAAPAAAALALAAVMGFGALVSARGGQGEVPEDGQLTQLHKKEMVLPAWIAEPLRRNIRAPSSSGMFSNAAAAGSSLRESNTTNGGNSTFNYQPNHTNMNADFNELLRRDGRTLRKWFKNEMRNGSIKVS